MPPRCQSAAGAMQKSGRNSHESGTSHLVIRQDALVIEKLSMVVRRTSVRVEPREELNIYASHLNEKFGLISVHEMRPNFQTALNSVDVAFFDFLRHSIVPNESPRRAVRRLPSRNEYRNLKT